MAVQIILKNSAVEGKNPTASQLAKGEIALNFHESGPYLTCEDSAGNVKRIAGVQQGSSQPSNPLEGAFWWKTDADALYLYAEGSWTLVGGGGGGSGTVTDILGGDGIVVTDGSGPETTVDVDLAGGNDGLEFDGGKLSASIASSTVLGSVKVDNTTITANSSGVITAATQTGTTNLGIANHDESTLDVTSSNGEDVTIPAATTSLCGLLTAADKTTIDGLSNPLQYQGTVDLTSATVVSGLDDNDVGYTYANTGTGNVSTEWAAISTATTSTAANPGDIVVWKGTSDKFTYIPTGTPIPALDLQDVTDEGNETTNDIVMTGTGSLKLPVGLDAERPSTPAAGMVRYTNQNTTPPVAAGKHKGFLDITTSTAEPGSPAVGDTYTVETTGTIVSSWKTLLNNEPSAGATKGDYIVCQVAGGGSGNWTYVSTSDPANFVEMYNGSNWVQMLDETTVGTSPDQVPANQMLGQMAFIDHVATLRPFTTPLANTLPVFVGECIVIWDDTNNELVYRYRDTATTYRQATVSFGAQVTG